MADGVHLGEVAGGVPIVGDRFEHALVERPRVLLFGGHPFTKLSGRSPRLGGRTRVSKGPELEVAQTLERALLGVGAADADQKLERP